MTDYQVLISPYQQILLIAYNTFFRKQNEFLLRILMSRLMKIKENQIKVLQVGFFRTRDNKKIKRQILFILLQYLSKILVSSIIKNQSRTLQYMNNLASDHDVQLSQLNQNVQFQINNAKVQYPLSLYKYEILCKWSFDPENIQKQFSFQSKLSKKNNWTIQFTQQVISQYRKFLFLLAVFGRCAPSKAIDQAWHQHILRTKNYSNLCKQISENYIHHQPVFNVKQQIQCHNVFDNMIESYISIFGQPPEDIWETNVKSKCMKYCYDDCYGCHHGPDPKNQ